MPGEEQKKILAWIHLFHPGLFDGLLRLGSQVERYRHF
jgi:hypothetical protein